MVVSGNKAFFFFGFPSMDVRRKRKEEKKRKREKKIKFLQLEGKETRWEIELRFFSLRQLHFTAFLLIPVECFFYSYLLLEIGNEIV